jgi:periplasmic protein TonB
MQRSATTYSAALHFAAIFSLFYVFRAELIPVPANVPARHHVTLWNQPLRSLRPAGAGQRETLPASRGRLPPRPARRMFLPPTAHIVNSNPKVPVMQAIVLNPDIPAPDIRHDFIGHPLGLDGPFSGGPGGPAGIGGRGCCGVGNDNGSGLDGVARPVPASKGRIIRPALLFKVDPEYSEEARKAKVQGTVLLIAEVDENGRTGKIRVVQPLGLGPDEKAIAAAALWRFRPATTDGNPVPYSVMIEVNFRLL